jgi:hypothetical protein
LASTLYGAPPAAGVTCRPNLYSGALGPADGDVIVVPVSAMLSIIASLGTPFFTEPAIPVILRIKKSTGHLLLGTLPARPSGSRELARTAAALNIQAAQEVGAETRVTAHSGILTRVDFPEVGSW